MSSRISSLPVVISVNIVDTDILPIVTGVASNTLVTKRVAISELRARIAGGIIGPSADRGDTSPTLLVGVDFPIQQFATALTANRIITLSTTGAYKGAEFRIVRTGLGAFTLAVAALKTIPSGIAAFVDVMFDGIAWQLTGYGTL